MDSDMRQLYIKQPHTYPVSYMNFHNQTHSKALVHQTSFKAMGWISSVVMDDPDHNCWEYARTYKNHMATNQTECLPYKGDYAAYVSPDFKVGYNTLILQLYITQTRTNTQKVKAHSKHRIRHAHCLLCDSLPCGIYRVDASEWEISNTVFQCDRAKTNANNEMSSSIVIQWVYLIQKKRPALRARWNYR